MIKTKSFKAICIILIVVGGFSAIGNLISIFTYMGLAKYGLSQGIIIGLVISSLLALIITFVCGIKGLLSLKSTEKMKENVTYGIIYIVIIAVQIIISAIFSSQILNATLLFTADLLGETVSSIDLGNAATSNPISTIIGYAINFILPVLYTAFAYRLKKNVEEAFNNTTSGSVEENNN